MTDQMTLPVETLTTPSFCTGHGQFDSHAKPIDGKPSNPKAGTPYSTVTEATITSMVADPPSVQKEAAQWFIPSEYADHDGRDFDQQKAHGLFWWLPLDLDENSPLLQDVAEGVAKVVGEAVTRLIYSSRSAQEGVFKWRVLIPLSEPIDGSDYSDTMAAFNDLLEDASDGVLIPDRALERTGQLVYLPNKGKFYTYEIHKGDRLDLTDHPIIQRRDETRRKRSEVEAEARARRERKAMLAPTDASSIVDAFNVARSITDLLDRYGYKKAGHSAHWRSPMQTGASYAMQDRGDHWISLSASDAAAEVGEASANGHRFGDAFDLFVHFEHGGNFKAAIKAYAEETGQDHKSKRAALNVINPAKTVKKPDKASETALRIAKQITDAIKDKLPDLKADPAVDPLIIQAMIEGAFWSGEKSRVFLLNEAETLVQFAANDAWKFLCRRFGSPVDADKIIKQIETDTGRMKPTDEEAARKIISSATTGPIVDHLKYENQRDRVAWSVDMFGHRSWLDLREDAAHIVLTHRPLIVRGAPVAAHVTDYKSHFPLLDETLEYIVASRFALDRKKSYLWMLAASDWGKSFFLGVLTDLGLVVEMSVKEIEAVFEGKPSRKTAEDFKRSLVLAVDEFKGVKSELKQLTSYIDLAPKFQLNSRVEIYTKLFLSAESVASLVGESGVEDQFANRMSLLTGSGTLSGRTVFRKDQGGYFRSVRAYVATEINRLVGEYQALGRDGSERRADKYLTGFIGRHGLDQSHERLSEGYPEIAAQAVRWFKYEYDKRAQMIIRSGGHAYLRRPAKTFEDFLKENFTMSEIGTLARRKDEIMMHMCPDGRGVKTHRINGQPERALKLKDL